MSTRRLFSAFRSDIYLSRALSSFLLGDLSSAGNDCRVFLEFGQEAPQDQGICPYILSSATAQASNGTTTSTGNSRPNSIRSEMDQVEASRNYIALPPAQSAPSRSAIASGMVARTVENGTSYVLRVAFSGPVDQEIELQPGEKRSLMLPVGTYRVLGRVSAPNVLPFFGTQSYEGGAEYPSRFHIQ